MAAGSATSAIVGSVYRRGAQGSIQQWRMEVQAEPFEMDDGGVGADGEDGGERE